MNGKGTFTEATFSFTETEGFRALGVALEDNSGVVVENHSLRGNSGMILNRLERYPSLPESDPKSGHTT